MNINIKSTVDYEVKCYEGVKIKLKYLTVGETQEVREYIPAKKNSKDKIIKPATFAYDTEKMFKYMVLKIENLTLTENGKVTEIKNGIDIFNNPGLDDLYMELYVVLIGMDARVDLKN